ncbi:uncharacterized protein LOC114244899 [Bombyx mandarina]|uniref:Uncharacterized protein LOC114244899 n=1 Tax=Bombyx mandarina TaxID=7092 RepID=A0A6J2JS65_BOMMA|nr:uncharacterized protein LOC114244899 [Bombyx mandarina]
MFESVRFRNWTNDIGSEIHFITPEMHNENGQAERYCRTVLNMIRVEIVIRQNKWSDALWRIQLVLNCTKHKTTNTSPMQLLIGIDGATPAIRCLVRDVALENNNSNREALRELQRQAASNHLEQNRRKQDAYVNKNRKVIKLFKVNDLVFVAKVAQMTGKLDSGMRGPYRVLHTLPRGRYELQLLGGAYGKTTQAAGEYMVLWRGEWSPEACGAFFNTNDDIIEQPDRDAVHTVSPASSEVEDGHDIKVNVDVHQSGEAVLEATPS